VAVLGLDLGTSAVKALVLDDAGGPRRGASAPSPVDAPRPGWAEAEPERWLDAAAEAVRGALAAAEGAGPVRALGLSGQMHGVVVCDADGAPRRPALLWPDRRAADALGPWEALPVRRRAALGNPLTPGMAGPLLAWLAAHEREALAGAAWALQPKDWVRLRLCGDAGAEPTDSSATLLWDLPADRWATDVAAAAGIDPALLAPVGDPFAVAGALRPAAAERLGLPAGIAVHTGLADTAAALLGAGVGAPGGPRLVNLGTGAQVVVAAARPDAPSAPRTHRLRAARGWYAMGAVQNAGLALGWALRALGLDWEAAEALAFPPSGPAPDTGELLFLPQLTGERTPFLDPDARGAWLGLGLHHERAHLVRAAYEGVAHAVRAARDALAEEADGAGGDGPWRLLGGGSVRPGYRRLLAATLGAPLELLAVADASALGAALVAAGQARRDPPVAGHVEPDPAEAAWAAERHPRWVAAVRRLAGPG
jgi:xylulokinase